MGRTGNIRLIEYSADSVEWKDGESDMTSKLRGDAGESLGGRSKVLMKWFEPALYMVNWATSVTPFGQHLG